MKLNTKALAEVELGMPIIAEGVYHARIEKPEVKANKRGDGNNLVVAYRILDNPLVSHKEGKEFTNNGQVKLTRYYSLVPNENYDPDKSMKELAVAIKLDPTADLTLEELEGKLVMVKVGYKAATEPSADERAAGKKAYPAGNEIDRVTPVKDDDTFTPPPF